LEFFLLRGDLSLQGTRVGSGGYVHVPQGCGGGELASVGGATAFVFWNPNAPCFSYPLTRNRVVDPLAEPWVDSIPGAHGIRHKSLRKPDPVPHPSDEGFDGGPGGYLRFQYIEPNTIARDEHVHHECFEEIILLAGDCLLVNEGQMAPGSVVNHPQEWYHAPFFSRTGALILVHTDAPMGFPWPPRPYPDADALAQSYFDGGDWRHAPDHVAWRDHPLCAQQEASSGYKNWRMGDGAALWGDRDPGRRVPEMPGGRAAVSGFRAGLKRTV
jgi:hypothetical protein